MAHAPKVITGTVRDALGKPIAQARVFFRSGPGSFPDIAALTDDRGAFSLSAPSVGTYDIECVAEGFAAESARVTVAGEQEYGVNIKLTTRLPERPSAR